MKHIVWISVPVLAGLVLSACASSAGASPSTNAGGAAQSAAGPAAGSGPSGIATPVNGLSGLQLAAGMLKLDGTSNAVTAQEASQLLPLWQSLQQMEAAATPPTGQGGTPGPRFNPAMMQPMSNQIQSIENAMPPAQLQAIIALNLSRQDIFTTLQQAGITMGGFGQGGGGFRPNGGTFTPPQATPPAPGTPGAFPRNGSGFGGGRPGLGSFLPPSVVDGMVQFLQKRAAT